MNVKNLQNKLLINNKWVSSASGKTFPVINPANGSKITDVHLADEEDINRAVAAARKAFETWGKSSPVERGKLLYRLAELLEQNKEELAKLESLNTGKPLKTHTMTTDVPSTIECFRYYAGWADKLEGKTIPLEMNNFAFTRYEPVGVVGQIIPWNWPLLMMAWKFGPALAAGCTIVLKPSQFTPLTALRVGELIIEAGFPPGVVNILTGAGSITGDILVKHPGIDKIAFTGSTSVGKGISKLAVDSNLKRTTLELGGKGPHIIFADSDVEEAAKTAIHGLFFNAGQNCAAGSRVYVEETIHDEFVHKLVELLKKRKVGDPFDDDTAQGPQITKKQFDKILEYIKVGQEEGAKLACGGKRVGDKGFFIEPTVFTHAKDDSRIVKEEIFGPVLVVLKFKDINEVIDRANDSIYGLTAGVFTRDVTKALAVANNIRAGTVWINTFNDTNTAIPFGGFKESGIGRELGFNGLLNYLEVKSVCVSLEKMKQQLSPGHPPIVSTSQ